MPCTISESCFNGAGCSPSVDPTPGAVYAPYVKLLFSGFNIVTVGNKSTSPELKDLATVTSFEFGMSPGDKGYGADIEILDAGGTAYKKIIGAMNKTVGRGEKEYFNVWMDWGWIVTSTGGSTRLISAFTETGLRFGGMFSDAETNFEGGNVKIKIKVRGVQANELSVSYTGTMGAEDQLMDLVTAIKQLFTRYSQISDVKFKLKDQIENDGDGFFEGGGMGPRAAWPMQQSNAFTIARMWTASVRTVYGKGIIMVFRPEDNTLVFCEDPSDKDCCANSVATFVVNGGNCSPVISFNPTVNWPKGMIPGGGGVAGGSSTANQDNILEPPPEVEQAGTQSMYGIQQQDWIHRVPDDHAEQAKLSGEANQNTENSNGLAIGGGKPGFTAELKIIGDPFFSTVLGPVKKPTAPDEAAQPDKIPGLFGKFLSIIFINPFYIANDDESYGYGATWLQDSTCNPILSNKKYLILGVSHQISSGSYTTTFKLKVLLPNVEIPIDAGVGFCGDSWKISDYAENGMGEAQALKTNTGGSG